MNTVIYSGIGTTVAAAVVIGIEYIKHKPIKCVSEIKSKKDSISFLKCLCCKSTSADDLNDSLLINLRNEGYSKKDKERIHKFLEDNPNPTEEFALTVIWSMILYYEDLMSYETNTNTLNCEQNLVSF